MTQLINFHYSSSNLFYLTGTNFPFRCIHVSTNCENKNQRSNMNAKIKIECILRYEFVLTFFSTSTYRPDVQQTNHRPSDIGMNVHSKLMLTAI